MGEPTSDTSETNSSSGADLNATIDDDSWVDEDLSEVSSPDDATVARRRPRELDNTVLVGDSADGAQRALSSARRYKLAVFALLALAGLMTLGAAVRFWLPPWAPLFAFVVLGAGPLFFWACVGALIFDPTKTREGFVGEDSPPLGQRLRLALVPVVGAALVGSAFAALWYAAPVRVMVAELSTSQRLVETLDSALRDDHADVRLAACQGLAELKDDTSTQLVAAVSDPDEAVVDCALEALPAQPVATPQLSGTALRWHLELMQSPDGVQTGERACMLSNRLRVAERKGLQHSAMQLMTCALDANSGPARECCSQSFRAMLGGNQVEPSMVMPPAIQLIYSGFHEAVPSLLKATHSKEPQWERKRLALRLDTANSKAWAMSLGCEALNVGGVQLRDSISHAMAEAVSTDSCRISPAQETTVRLWTAVCSELFTPQTVSSADGTESDKFCAAINGTLVVDASNEARRRSQEAMRSARAPERQQQMMRMLLDYSSRVAKASLGDDGAALSPTEMMFGNPTGSGGKSSQSSVFAEMMKMFTETQAGTGGRRDGSQPPSDPTDQMMKMLFDQGAIPQAPADWD